MVIEQKLIYFIEYLQYSACEYMHIWRRHNITARRVSSPIRPGRLAINCDPGEMAFLRLLYFTKSATFRHMRRLVFAGLAGAHANLHRSDSFTLRL